MTNSELSKCIVVKTKKKLVQFRHQFLYTGEGSERRCHFCQLTVPDLPQAEKPWDWNDWKRNLAELKFKTSFNCFRRTIQNPENTDR